MGGNLTRVGMTVVFTEGVVVSWVSHTEKLLNPGKGYIPFAGCIDSVYFSDFWLDRDGEQEGIKQGIVDMGDEDLSNNWEEGVCGDLRLSFGIKDNEFNPCNGIVLHPESGDAVVAGAVCLVEDH